MQTEGRMRPLYDRPAGRARSHRACPWDAAQSESITSTAAVRETPVGSPLPFLPLPEEAPASPGTWRRSHTAKYEAKLRPEPRTS